MLARMGCRSVTKLGEFSRRTEDIKKMYIIDGITGHVGARNGTHSALNTVLRRQNVF